MEVDATAAGFQKEKLARIGTHLRENYVDPGKIPGCQVWFLDTVYPLILSRWSGSRA